MVASDVKENRGIFLEKHDVMVLIFGDGDDDGDAVVGYCDGSDGDNDSGDESL